VSYNIELMAEEFNEEEEMIINQEYKIWKKESPDFYDFLLLHSLDWPSYSFQWLPTVEHQPDRTLYHALLASNTTDPEHNHLLKVQISFPNDNAPDAYFSEKTHKVKIIEKIPHPGEINRARYCPA
jgi:histone-binding protein RBBP4